MAEQVIQCNQACTVTVQHQIPLLSIDAGEASQIGYAVLLVWAVAWGIRQLIRMIRVDDSSTFKDEP